MSTAVSPLAPTEVPDMPAIEGVKLATAAAGIRYKGRTDVMLALLDKGTTVAGVFTKSKCPSAPVEWCRAKLKGGQGARAGGQFRQCQCLHRQDRHAVTALTAPLAAKAIGCSASEIFLASTGVIGEPLDATKFDGVLGDARGKRRARRLDGRGQSDHDHRHLSEGRDRDGQARQGEGHHQRHGQGRRHDRARYGDDAGVRVHRRAAVGGRAAIAAQERRRGHLQRHHHRQRHLDLGHAARLCDRRGRRERRAEDQPRQRSPAEGLRQSVRARCSPISPNRWRATAKARASWSRSSSRARPPRPRRARSRCRSPIRRW